MAEFKKLSEVEVTNEVTEITNVLIEDDGIIKKISINLLIDKALEDIENGTY